MSEIAEDTMLTFGDLTLDSSKRLVMCNGKKLRMGPVACQLLRLLMKNPLQRFDTAQLRAAIWGEHSLVENADISHCVNTVRSILNKNNSSVIIDNKRQAGGYTLALKE